MRRICLSSVLAAPAEQVWHEQVAVHGGLADPGCGNWPRTATVLASSLLYRRCLLQRRIEKTVSGCVVEDSVEFDPRLPLLEPWLDAIRRRALRRSHEALNRRYRRG